MFLNNYIILFIIYQFRLHVLFSQEEAHSLQADEMDDE